jgi:hypothetical protein
MVISNKKDERRRKICSNDISTRNHRGHIPDVRSKKPAPDFLNSASTFTHRVRLIFPANWNPMRGYSMLVVTFDVWESLLRVPSDALCDTFKRTATINSDTAPCFSLYSVSWTQDTPSSWCELREKRKR